MNLSQTRSFFNNPLQLLSKTRLRSSALYGFIIILAMFAFEGFNFGTTNYALGDLLGGLSFAGIPWATLMALAFCGLDFAGIARLITQNGREENPRSSWYLFGAWLIAATFNAALTWWGSFPGNCFSRNHQRSTGEHRHANQDRTGHRSHHGMGHPHPDHRLTLQRA